MIRTGIKKLDEILGGGIRDGIIVDIFGASGTGKTLLALQIMAHSLSGGGRVFYQDTTGSFRPERLVDLLRARNLDRSLLDRITVGRATNTREQVDGIRRILEGDYTLAVIDNVTDLFSFEYSKEEQLLERTTQFAKYMRSLSGAASARGIPVVTVNMVRKLDMTERENLEPLISLFAHIRVRLAREQRGYRGEVMLNAKRAEFSYAITGGGLSDPS